MDKALKQLGHDRYGHIMYSINLNRGLPRLEAPFRASKNKNKTPYCTLQKEGLLFMYKWN